MRQLSALGFTFARALPPIPPPPPPPPPPPTPRLTLARPKVNLPTLVAAGAGAPYVVAASAAATGTTLMLVAPALTAWRLSNIARQSMLTSGPVTQAATRLARREALETLGAAVVLASMGKASCMVGGAMWHAAPMLAAPGALLGLWVGLQARRR